MRKHIFFISFFFLQILVAYGQREIEVLQQKAETYRLGFYAGLALDDVQLLAGQKPLDKVPRVGYSYGISYTRKSWKPLHFDLNFQYAIKGFLQRTGSPYGNNALYSAHYLELLPRGAYRIRPNLQIQCGLGAGLRMSELLRSDDVSVVLGPNERMYPAYTFLFSPSLQFGADAFFTRFSYDLGLLPVFRIAREEDGRKELSTVRQQRVAVSIGYFFHR